MKTPIGDYGPPRPLTQDNLNALLRICVWEIIFGSGNVLVLYDRMQELFALGAMLTKRDEPAYTDHSAESDDAKQAA